MIFRFDLAKDTFLIFSIKKNPERIILYSLCPALCKSVYGVYRCIQM